MEWHSSHARAPHRLQDPHTASLSDRDQYHKREPAQTLGATFVSTTVVPAPSSSDVLSSLISSLTILSDTAREQLRSARQLEPSHHKTTGDPPRTVTASSSHSHANSTFSDISTNIHDGATNLSDGDEAEPPSVGYPKARPTRRRQSSLREILSSHGSTKDKPVNFARSGSSNTVRRPNSGMSSIGIPSIERAHSGSTGSLVIAATAGAKSPTTMLVSERPEDEHQFRSVKSQRDPDVTSVRTIRTMVSKHNTKKSHDLSKESHVSTSTTPTKSHPSTKQNNKSVLEHKPYSPLNPAHRDDLGEHLIPSRHSSMRHKPNSKESTKVRSVTASRIIALRSKSLSAGPEDASNDVLIELPVEEEDSTLRRIRELQQAKEKRHNEWRQESKGMDRSVRHSARSRSRTNTQGFKDDDQLTIDATEELNSGTDRHTKILEKAEVETLEPTIRYSEIGLPGSNAGSPMPSPALTGPRKHKRSLSAGLRRSTSSRRRPVDELRSVSEQVEAFLTAPRLTQRIRHPRTGRTIAFSEVGDPNGYAVFCCVGMGLTRYVTSFYDDVARTQRLRLITPDRPGIGESSPFADNSCTPLSWVDDVAIICQALNIDQFSLMAHSAGAIYALATALKMPDRVRGRIHLLAPWIPPSQFLNGGSSGDVKAVNLPLAHKLLSVLPAPFLKAANSRFLSATSASIESKSNRGWKKDRSINSNYDTLLAEMAADIQPSNLAADAMSNRHSTYSPHGSTSTPTPMPSAYPYTSGLVSPPLSPSPVNMKRQYSNSAVNLRSTTPAGLTPQARQALLDSELTHRTWTLATLNANPAIDLLICLERRRPIGFKYTDVQRGVVIHHGRKDARVPLENIQWLSKVMKRCELRVIDNEGHGLMASANVMSKVLSEIGYEREEWEVTVLETEKKLKDEQAEGERIREMERKKFSRGRR